MRDNRSVKISRLISEEKSIGDRKHVENILPGTVFSFLNESQPQKEKRLESVVITTKIAKTK